MLSFMIPLAPIVQLTRPSGLSFTALSSSSLKLDWLKGETGAVTQVYRDGSLVATVAAGTETLTETGLTSGLTYMYILRHYQAASGPTEARWSGNITINAYTEPAVPTSFAATDVASTGALTWANPNPSLSTQVWRAVGGGASSLLATAGTGVALYNDTGLADGTYHYKLRATDGVSAFSAYTAIITVTIDTAVSPPTGLSVSMAGSTATVTWTYASAGLQTRVYRDGVQVSGNITAGVQTYDDTGLAVGTYTWTARHWNGSSESADSNSDTDSVATYSPPTSLAASNAVYSDRITLTWVNGTSQPTEIWRATGGGSSSLLTTVTTGTTSYDDNSVAYGGTTYHYKLRHANGGSYSDYTSIVSQATGTPGLSLTSLDANWDSDLFVATFSATNMPQSATVDATGMTDDSGFGSSPWADATGLTSPATVADASAYYSLERLSTGFPLATFTLGTLAIKLGGSTVASVSGTTVDYRYDGVV